jgi:hypothetical protein
MYPTPYVNKDWKKEITELWVTRMYDIDYLKTLVESMPGGCRM